jgi:hypothetical protein
MLVKVYIVLWYQQYGLGKWILIHCRERLAHRALIAQA